MKKTQKRNKKTAKEKNKEDIVKIKEDDSNNITDKEAKDNLICWISDGEVVLKEGEAKVSEWAF